MKVRFQRSVYEVIFTEHSKLQMSLRELTESEVLDVIGTGEVKPKTTPGKYWIYKELLGRKDNLISVSISIEKPHLIVITTMVNWRPQ
jgi:hypothetical protein